MIFASMILCLKIISCARLIVSLILTILTKEKLGIKRVCIKTAIKDYDEALKIYPNYRAAYEKREIALQQIQKKLPKTTEVEFWKSVRETKDPDELKAYIEAYPIGKFSPIPKLRMQKLK